MTINEAFQLAFKQYQAGNFHYAESICKEILRVQQENIDVLHLLGLIHYQQEHFDSSIQYIQKVIQLDPGNTHAYCNLGNALSRKRLFDEAINCYQRAILLGFNITDIFYNLGNALIQRGQFIETVTPYSNIKHAEGTPHNIFQKRKLTNNVIHCIGDSHVCFFSWKDGIHPQWPDYIGENMPFLTYRLGACLAYSLCTFNSTTKGREMLLLLLSFLPKQSNILLCFGEIDCRSHLCKQADIQKRSYEDIVKECVNKYFGVILEIKTMGFSVGAWGAIPSTDFSDYEADHPFPSYGTVQQRNTVTRLFNNYLGKLCSKNDIIFVSIFEDLINPDLNPKMEYFIDQNHLSQNAFSMAISKIKVAYRIV
jgi:hypothetical protein